VCVALLLAAEPDDLDIRVAYSVMSKFRTLSTAGPEEAPEHVREFLQALYYTGKFPDCPIWSARAVADAISDVIGRARDGAVSDALAAAAEPYPLRVLVALAALHENSALVRALVAEYGLPPMTHAAAAAHIRDKVLPVAKNDADATPILHALLQTLANPAAPMPRAEAEARVAAREAHKAEGRQLLAAAAPALAETNLIQDEGTRALAVLNVLAAVAAEPVLAKEIVVDMRDAEEAVVDLLPALKCEACGKQFKRPLMFQRHRNVSACGAGWPYRCPVQDCRRRAKGSANALWRHLMRDHAWNDNAALAEAAAQLERVEKNAQ
jgi:hypothetical protein